MKTRKVIYVDEAGAEWPFKVDAPKTQTKATRRAPTPWIADKDGDLLDADGNPISVKDQPFILAAVNSHDELLHVAKAYVAICEAKNIKCDGAKAIIQRAERGSK
jgi:hypothetical protein